MLLREKFKAYNAQTSPAPLMLEFVKAEGSCLIDAKGKKYLDFISGISVSNWGHGNADVVNAISSQAAAYLHQMVYGEYVQSPQVLLAEKIISLLPVFFEQVYLVNSGSEAVEGALKTAVRFNGRKKIVAAGNAYHGSTTGALSLMSNPYFTAPFKSLTNPNVDFITYNSFDDVGTITEETCCVILEVVQGEAGYIPADPDFLSAVRKRCDETGALLIFDEIQSGMGRTGKWFAFEHYNVRPDILLLAKALGAGLPLGAFITSKNIMECLSDEPVLGHITTYGGNPVCCAAALAGINFALQNAIVEKVSAKSDQLRSALAGLPISGKGLMLAMSFETEQRCKQAIAKILDEGIITDWFLHAADKLRLAPPLTITGEELDFAIEVIRKHV